MGRGHRSVHRGVLSKDPTRFGKARVANLDGCGGSFLQVSVTVKTTTLLIMDGRAMLLDFLALSHRRGQSQPLLIRPWKATIAKRAVGGLK